MACQTKTKNTKRNLADSLNEHDKDEDIEEMSDNEPPRANSATLSSKPASITAITMDAAAKLESSLKTDELQAFAQSSRTAEK